MNTKKLVDIIIVNWNSSTQLAEAIASIEQNHNNNVNSVIIVDNASTDKSFQQVKSVRSNNFHLQLLESPVNLGFAAACNKGAHLSKAKYLLFLNPDCRLFTDSIAKPIDILEADEGTDVGIIGIQLIDESNNISRSCARFPTPLGLTLHSIGIDKILPTKSHRMTDWDHLKNKRVDHVIGAFFLVRHEVFKNLMGFDERFFVYLEDIDFSFRANQAGWRSLYLAECSAFHAGGGTSSQVKSIRLFYSLRSRLLYALKHFSTFQASVVLIATLGIEPISRLALATIRRSPSNAVQTLAAYKMLWRDMPRIIRSRDH